MLWLAIIGFLSLRAAEKARTDVARRAVALKVAAAMGLLPLLGPIWPANSGWMFRATSLDSLKSCLNGAQCDSGWVTAGTAANPRSPAHPFTPSPFRSGHWYFMHEDHARCERLGDCRDYRSIGGVFGPGSLQVVLNERTGHGYFDYDRFSPYDGLRAFINHAGEI